MAEEEDSKVTVVPPVGVSGAMVALGLALGLGLALLDGAGFAPVPSEGGGAMGLALGLGLLGGAGFAPVPPEGGDVLGLGDEDGLGA